MLLSCGHVTKGSLNCTQSVFHQVSEDELVSGCSIHGHHRQSLRPSPTLPDPPCLRMQMHLHTSMSNYTDIPVARNHKTDFWLSFASCTAPPTSSNVLRLSKEKRKKGNNPVLLTSFPTAPCQNDLCSNGRAICWHTSSRHFLFRRKRLCESERVEA